MIIYYFVTISKSIPFLFELRNIIEVNNANINRIYKNKYFYAFWVFKFLC